MKRCYSYNHDKAILYLVATPIGNLDDITYRAVDTLRKVSYIYAEDTRNSMVLLNHYDIKTPLRSYHDFNKELKNDEIIEILEKGESVAIISDAGNPVISDPGYNICVSCIEHDIAVTTIPGACAYLSALVSSGLPPMPNTFIGFLDSKKSKRCEMLNEYKYVTHTLIFYEAPHRIIDTLNDMLEVLGDRYIVISRELTKKFEEIIRGNISEILKDTSLLKGEMVVLVSGFSEEKSEKDPMEMIDELISLGYRNKDAIKETALALNLDRRELYDKYILYKNNK
ncbi:MAG: 16S rRNA (cytidine(1402)-2'-O)-methyltransferase [Acholeplasmatales bacterium]|nr:16S rRNA (cytidine(1402)-2'-O)-methyltransferase [Acholeplasmatales bacterium]